MNHRVLIRRCVFAALAAGFVPLSYATHRVEHRYTIYGQAVDESRAPVVNAVVVVSGFGGRPMGKTTTDANGQYSVLLHVHDQGLGASFWVTVRGVTQSGKVTFDIADRVTDRTRRLDFTVPGAD